MFAVQGFTQHSDHSTVDILVHLPEENLMAAKQEGLLKKFKLTSTISTSNMHLFDANGVIKKYDTPEKSMRSYEYVCLFNAVYLFMLFYLLFVSLVQFLRNFFT